MSEKIAVIGLSFRYPDIDSVDAFDELLRNGKSITSDNADERGNLLGIADYKKLLGKIQCLSEIEYFDNNFFGIVKKEAKEMSPEMKLSLVHSIQAIYDAGYSLEQMKNSECGMVVSQSNSPYKRLLGHGSSTAYFDSLPAMTGSNLAFYFDLKGPTYSVDSTCSSSLFAVYQACQVLLSKQADMMLAGGSQIVMPLDKSDTYELKGDGASAKDLLIPFDEKADGFILGEGTGFVLLKRYDDAIRDGDYIYGTILGTGISGTGATRMSVYAPDGKAQSQAIQRAWINAGISADDIDEIEAHGTATELGDLNEINGLKVCLENRKNPDKVMISAVKSNVGHTSQVAGISSLIKTLLSFENNVIYPIANFSKPNPNIDFEAAKIKPVEKFISVPIDKKRIVGIDSYGLNALNVHMVVENHIKYHKKSNVIQPINRILKLSAKTESSLRAYCSNISHMVKKGERNINDLIYTLNTGRDDFRVRASICFDTVEELCQKLELIEPVYTNIEERLTVSDYIYNNREAIATAYINGANIDFDKYYANVIFHKVPAPGYSFDKIFNWFTEKKEMNTSSKLLVKSMALTDSETISCKIKKIWQEILETDEDIAEDETFFELGGNSMLGTMMIEMITEELDVEITIADIYKYNTIKLLSEYICTQENIEDVQSLKVTSAEKSQNSYEDTHDLIKKIWQEILETDEDIAEDETFFELGGNSMLGTMMIETIAEELNVEITIADIYKYNTIKLLSEYICTQENMEDVQSLKVTSVEKSQNSYEDTRDLIKKIWQEILETDEDIAEDETFFELGGNSMLGTMMIETIAEELDVEITIADIYKYNTLRLLAEYICTQAESVNEQQTEELIVEESQVQSLKKEGKSEVSNIVIHNKVKEAWRKILETNEEIADDDSFFDLGGNSVLVEELKDELNITFDVSMDSDDIYENSTIETLTEYISNL